MSLVFIGVFLIMATYLFTHWVEGFDLFTQTLGCNSERALALEELSK